VWRDTDFQELVRLAVRWVELVSEGDDSPSEDDDVLVIDEIERVILMGLFAPLEQSLIFIDEVVRLTDSAQFMSAEKREDVLYRLGAGLLEDVFTRHGHECIDWSLMFG
jgi:hypothetical protein